MARPHAFTISARGGLLRELITEVRLCAAFNPATDNTDRLPFRAIWDTGATASVITERVVKDCGLQPTGKTKISGVTGSIETEVYMVDLGLPNGVLICGIKVCRAPIKADTDMLIGMDVIVSGDFAVSTFKGKTVFTFRIPSLDAIDFVKHPYALGTKVGRNQQCPCRSGKKYKNCCGKLS